MTTAYAQDDPRAPIHVKTPPSNLAVSRIHLVRITKSKQRVNALLQAGYQAAELREARTMLPHQAGWLAYLGTTGVPEIDG